MLNVLGAGDAFLGLLYGWLNGRPLPESARLGNACGALVVSRHGCTPAMPSRVELDDLARASDIASGSRRSPRAHPPRDDGAPASARRAVRACVRSSPPARTARGRERRAALSIARFKDLICAAVERVAAQVRAPERLGVIVDARHGSAVLNRLARTNLWIGRPIECGSRPLAFDPDDNTALHSRRGPPARSSSASSSTIPTIRSSCGWRRNAGSAS